MKIIYCQIPKSGCTNWMKIMAVLQGLISNTDEVDQVAVHNLPLKMTTYWQPKYKDYTKILAVRDPFLRALSCYKDKFDTSHGMRRSLFRNTAEKAVKMPGTPVDKENNVPSLEQFIRFISDESTNISDIHYSEPRHWLPQSEMSMPCHVKFDYIVKVESVADEAEFIFKKLHLPPTLNYPQGYSSKNSSQTTKELLQKHFSQVPLDAIVKLYRYYKKDFLLFGYDIPPMLDEITSDR